MALVIEDGTIVSGANSYATVAELNAYLSARGVFLAGTNGTAEQVLLLSMDYLESKEYLGTKIQKSQPLQWPREGVYLDGFLIDDDEIPAILKTAQIEVAIAIDGGSNPLSNLGRTTKREKVGEIEVEYASDAKDSTELRKVNAYLGKLLSSSGSGNFVSIQRA